MALNLNALSYPFDPTGSLASNLITGEQQILTAVNWTDYQFLVPRWAPFFPDSAVLTIQPPTGASRPLVMGVDWYPCFEFISASRACAQPIWGGIQFINPLLTGVVTMQYQTLGGIWTLDEVAIAALLADRLANPRITAWEQVTDQPVMFPVIDHEWDLVDLVGASDIVTALGGIEDMLRQSGATGLAAHLADYTNPHRVTATQVGLGLVQNYGIAQAADLTAGSSNTVYMTPAGTTTMMNNGPTAAINTHVANKANPHAVTAAQVGAYTIAQVNALLANYQQSGSVSADATLFDGMDAPTYRDWALSTGVASNSLEFGGQTPAAYATSVLTGTAAGANSVYGYTFAQLQTAILANGTAYNASNFNGMTPAAYAAYVLQGTAANATTAFGLTQAQLTAAILQGTAGNATLAYGLTQAQLSAAVLASGPAANSLQFNGMTPAAFATWVQANSTASNSNQLGGQTLQQVIAAAQAAGSYTDQQTVVQDSGLAAGTWWQQIVQMVLADGVIYTAQELNDAHWIVTVGGAGGVGTSSAYYVYVTIKDGSPTYAAMNSVCLSPVDIGITFGFSVQSIDHGSGAVPTVCVFAKGTQEMGNITVNAMGSGAKEIFMTTQDLSQNTEPNGIVYATGDRFALESEVTDVMNSLTTAFNTLAAQIAGS